MVAASVRVGAFEIMPTRVIGRGAYGCVYSAIQVGTQAPCAAKQMRMQEAATAALPEESLTELSTREEMQQELEVMQRVSSHPNIPTLFGHFLIEAHPEARLANSGYLFMEFCSGGELLDRMTDGGVPLAEAEIRPYAACIIDALAHCHARGIVHRDVKLDNILLSCEEPGLAKLTDFGLAERLEGGQRLFDSSGTPGYRAPEMFTRKQTGFDGAPCDCWAVAICIFALAAGGFPWADDALNEQEQIDGSRGFAEDPCFAHVRAGQAGGKGSCASLTEFITRHAPRPCPFSVEMQDLLDALLRIDPVARETMARCMAHPWVVAAGRGSAMSFDELDTSGYRDLSEESPLGADGDEAVAPTAIEGVKKIERRKVVREGKKKQQQQSSSTLASSSTLGGAPKPPCPCV